MSTVYLVMNNGVTVAVCGSEKSARKSLAEFIWAEGAEGNALSVHSLELFDGDNWVENSKLVWNP